jgi:hypothetical protein
MREKLTSERVFLWQMRIERARWWLSFAASVGSRNGSFLFFVAPATRQNHTRDEEQSRPRSISLQLSCSLCVSLSGANKHSCLNKVVGTMPGPIGGAGGYWGGGSRLTHTSTICIAIPIGKMLLPGCLPLLCPSNAFHHKTPPRYTCACYNGSVHIRSARFHPQCELVRKKYFQCFL